MAKKQELAGVSAISTALGVAISTLYERWRHDADLRAIVNRLQIGERTYWTALASDCARWRKAREKVKAARKAARS